MPAPSLKLAIAVLLCLCASPTGAEAEDARRDQDARTPSPSLCDLVEEALLATAPKPSPTVEFTEREERRRNIERIKRQVQNLRDQGRCG